MKKRTNEKLRTNAIGAMVFCIVSILSLTMILITAQWWIMGGLIGYGIGYINAEILMLFTLRSLKLEFKQAVRNMYIGFMIRLGIVTLVAVLVSRHDKAWLPSLAVGFAIGLILSLILKYKDFLNMERKG